MHKNHKKLFFLFSLLFLMGGFLAFLPVYSSSQIAHAEVQQEDSRVHLIIDKAALNVANATASKAHISLQYNIAGADTANYYFYCRIYVTKVVIGANGQLDSGNNLHLIDEYDTDWKEITRRSDEPFALSPDNPSCWSDWQTGETTIIGTHIVRGTIYSLDKKLQDPNNPTHQINMSDVKVAGNQDQFLKVINVPTDPGQQNYSSNISLHVDPGAITQSLLHAGTSVAISVKRLGDPPTIYDHYSCEIYVSKVAVSTFNPGDFFDANLGYQVPLTDFNQLSSSGVDGDGQATWSLDDKTPAGVYMIKAVVYKQEIDQDTQYLYGLANAAIHVGVVETGTAGSGTGTAGGGATVDTAPADFSVTGRDFGNSSTGYTVGSLTHYAMTGLVGFGKNITDYWFPIILGFLAGFGYIYGGAQMIMSAGDAKKAETGKKTILYTTIGLLLALTVNIIISVLNNLFGKVNP